MKTENRRESNRLVEVSMIWRRMVSGAGVVVVLSLSLAAQQVLDTITVQGRD